MILTAQHPDLSQQEKAYISTPVAVAATTIYVKSSANISATALILIGNIGSEATELKRVSGTGTGLITLDTTGGWTACANSHGVDTVITVLPYDEVRFYKSTTSGGTFTALIDVALDVDEESTKYDYTAGATTDYFKVAYHNSLTDDTSEQSGELAATGYGPQALSSIISDIRVFVGNKPEDADLIRLINLAQSNIYQLRDNWYFAERKHTVTTADSTNTYDLPVGFAAMKEVVFNDGTTNRELINYNYRKYMTDLAQDTLETDAQVYYAVNEADGEFIVHPAPSAGGKTVDIYYYEFPTPLALFTDVTAVPNVSAIVFWVVSKIESQKNNLDKARLYWNEYNAAIQQLSNKRTTKIKNFAVR